MATWLDDGDLRVAHDVTGSGPPLLLLHGAEGSRRMFDGLIPRLSAHFTTIAYDQRDCGETEGAARDVGLAGLADDAARLIHGLGFDEVHVYGTSFGGRVAQAVAHRHPHLVKSLVLGSTWPLPLALEELNPAGIRQILALRDRLPESADELAAWFLPEPFLAAHPDMRGIFRNAPVRGARSARRAAAVADAPALEPELIGARTLCIAAALDRVVPPAITLALADRIPGAQRVILEGAGHAAAVQMPEVIAHHLREFCVGAAASVSRPFG